MVDFMATYRQPRIITSPPGTSYRRIIAFTQRDSYGDAGYNGLVNAYNRLAPLPQPDSAQPNPSIRRLYYDRENVQSVEPAITEAGSLLTALLAEGTGTVSEAWWLVDEKPSSVPMPMSRSRTRVSSVARTDSVSSVCPLSSSDSANSRAAT